MRDPRSHFDKLAPAYHEEIPLHVREHLIRKWWNRVAPYLPDKPLLLDVGCGDGTNVEFMVRQGVDASGVDFSQGLVAESAKRYPQLAGKIRQGDALHMSDPSDTYDAVTLIGVLHHIYSREDQLAAVREALRVVKPGGVVIIRESNIRNPLFRLYWNYVFPLTAKIDRFGGENWIAVARLHKHFENRIIYTGYFTFIPSFIPAALLGMLARLEAWLESTWFGQFGAHYTVVLRK